MGIRIVLLLSLFLIGTTVDAHAQTKRRYKRNGTKFDIRYGVKIGYHRSNFTGDQYLSEVDSDNLPISPLVEYKPLYSYHAGAYVDMRITELFVFQPEIHYGVFGSEMIRRADLDNPEQNFMTSSSTQLSRVVDIPIERRLSTIQVPLIAKFGFTRLAHLNVGPVISFIQNEKSVYGDVPDSLLNIVQFISPFEIDMFKKLSFGAMIGFSYQLENGFNFNLRYNRNFSNINKNEFLAIRAEEPKNSTSAIMFSLGYTFTYEDRLKQNIGRRH